MFPPMDEDDIILLKSIMLGALGLLFVFVVIGIGVRLAAGEPKNRQLADSHALIHNGTKVFQTRIYASPFVSYINSSGFSDSLPLVAYYTDSTPINRISYHYAGENRDTVVCKIFAPVSSFSVIEADPKIHKLDTIDSGRDYLKSRGQQEPDL